MAGVDTPPGVVTVTLTGPPAWAGVVAFTVPESTTLNEAAGVPPKLTAEVAVRLVPVRVTDWPPATAPLAGVIAESVGARAKPSPVSEMLKFWPFQSPDEVVVAGPAAGGVKLETNCQLAPGDRKSAGQGKRVDLGGPRPLQEKNMSTALGPMFVTDTGS